MPPRAARTVSQQAAVDPSTHRPCLGRGVVGAMVALGLGVVAPPAALAMGAPEAQPGRALPGRDAVQAPLVTAAIRSHIAEKVGVAEHDVEVRSHGLGTDFPCGPRARLTVESGPSETFQRYVRLRVRGELAGEVCADLRVRAEVVVWEQVPVAAGTVRSGETISLSTGRVARHTLTGAPVDPFGGPYLAVGPLTAGAPVTVARVRTAPDWRSGSNVTIVAGGSGLTIRTPGRLLADAANGDRVRVANPATGAVVVGVITPDGLVRAQGAER